MAGNNQSSFPVVNECKEPKNIKKGHLELKKNLKTEKIQQKIPLS